MQRIGPGRYHQINEDDMDLEYTPRPCLQRFASLVSVAIIPPIQCKTGPSTAHSPLTNPTNIPHEGVAVHRENLSDSVGTLGTDSS